MYEIEGEVENASETEKEVAKRFTSAVQGMSCWGGTTDCNGGHFGEYVGKLSEVI